MDDYTSNVLNESQNKWSTMLMTNLTPHIINGFKSIFNESIELCNKNQEFDKYLMTFQNLLSRIPKWNQTIIENEKNRIINVSKCSYLEDLITCVHIIQLKILSCIRVGSEDKKININIPDFTTFLHKTYINIARKLYCNIYLFQVDVPPLEQQKNNREFELLVQTSIMNTINDNLPVEELLRKYMDETQEIIHQYKEEIPKEEIIIEDTNSLEENNPLEEQPLEEQPLEEQPLEEQPLEEQPLEEKPLEEEPLEEQPLDEQHTEISIGNENNINDDESLIDENYVNRLIAPKINKIKFHPDTDDNNNSFIDNLKGESIDLNELDIEEL